MHDGDHVGLRCHRCPDASPLELSCIVAHQFTFGLVRSTASREYFAAAMPWARRNLRNDTESGVRKLFIAGNMADVVGWILEQTTTCRSIEHVISFRLIGTITQGKRSYQPAKTIVKLHFIWGCCVAFVACMLSHSLCIHSLGIRNFLTVSAPDFGMSSSSTLESRASMHLQCKVYLINPTL